jgi:DNA polymerase III delta prime subunit
MFRPKTISDIAFPSTAARREIYDIINKRITFPFGTKTGIILHGVVGTGKSTCADLLPDAIEGQRSGKPAQPRIEKIRTQSNGVDLLSGIEETVRTWPNGDLHYVVLHEVDLLTSQAKEQLKLTMEFRDTVFIMTTNNLQNISRAVRSRSIEIDFNPESEHVWIPQAREVLRNNGIDEAKISDDLIINGIIRQANNIREIPINAQRFALKLLAVRAAQNVNPTA